MIPYSGKNTLDIILKQTTPLSRTESDQNWQIGHFQRINLKSLMIYIGYVYHWLDKLKWHKKYKLGSQVMRGHLWRV